MNPPNRRRVLIGGNVPELIPPPREESAKTSRTSKMMSNDGEDSISNAEKPTHTASNMVTPQAQSKLQTKFGTKTLKKVLTNVSDVSDAGSKKSKMNKYGEMGKEIIGTAIMRKGNEEQRKSFHYRLNTLNLVSSFMGLLGLIMQIIEVSNC